MPTRWPALTAFASVPPQVSSTSSRCAAMASRSTYSLIAQRFDRIELRCARGRGDAEHEAHENRGDGRDGRGDDGDRGAEREQPLQHLADADPEDDADDPAEQREGRGFDQELPQDGAARRTQRLA